MMRRMRRSVRRRKVRRTQVRWCWPNMSGVRCMIRLNLLCDRTEEVARADFTSIIVHSVPVQKRYLHIEEENQQQQRPELSRFWHQKLAHFFSICNNMDRKTEEYLYHLSCLEDEGGLAECLSQWPVFIRLYSEEYSTKLHTYWRQVGGTSSMIDSYKAGLAELEAHEPCNENELCERYEQVARVFLQAGVYSEALQLCQVAVKWEEKELGNRPDKMVELYSLMAEIYDEKLKLNDFVSPSQLPDLRKTISFSRKSIELREKMSSAYHKYKHGVSLMKLAFSLESWEACGGDNEMSGQAALQEGNRHIDSALTMFQELRDLGHYAEALMTKGVLAPRGSSQQLKYYNEALELCRQVYGDTSLLASRLYINIGIVHEDNKDYVRAFDFFYRWAKVSEAVLGPEHPKTLRAKGVLKEPRYCFVAQRLKDRPGDRDVAAEAINAEAGDVADSASENRPDAAAADELQLVINELIQRALVDDSRQELIQNILNTVRCNRARDNREQTEDVEEEDNGEDTEVEEGDDEEQIDEEEEDRDEYTENESWS